MLPSGIKWIHEEPRLLDSLNIILLFIAFLYYISTLWIYFLFWSCEYQILDWHQQDIYSANGESLKGIDYNNKNIERFATQIAWAVEDNTVNSWGDCHGSFSLHCFKNNNDVNSRNRGGKDQCTDTTHFPLDLQAPIPGVVPLFCIISSSAPMKLVQQTLWRRFKWRMFTALDWREPRNKTRLIPSC